LVLEDRTLPSTLTVLNNADHGDGSLRAAIADAHSGDQIIFDPSLRGQTIALTSGELTIDKGLDLEGLGADQLAVSGSHLSRVFDISGGVTVTITGLTVSDGMVFTSNSAALGGGIFNGGGNVTLANVVVQNNMARGAYGGFALPGYDASGGGIYSTGGALTIDAVTLANNEVIGGRGGDVLFQYQHGGDGGSGIGGGLYATGGSLDIAHSTIASNRATGGRGGDGVPLSSTPGGTGGPGLGGGLYVSGGALTIATSTISSNNATGGDAGVLGWRGFGQGGGLYNSGALTVSNSTLSGNSADQGGGIWTYYTYPVRLTNVTLTANRGGGLNVIISSPVLHNTLIAGNFAGGTGTTRYDVSGPLDPSGDYNLIGDGTGMTGLSNGVNGNLVGSADNPIDPLLGPLDDNGGPTLTHALLSGSPAVDAGNNAYAADWDQRGLGFRRIVNGVIDIGAFEVQAHAHSRPTGQLLPAHFPIHGVPARPLLGQPPNLPADPSPLPELGNPHALAGPFGRAAVPAAGGPQAAATRFVADSGNRQPANALGPPDACNLDPLAQELLGGP
jgi:hypothetical protein